MHSECFEVGAADGGGDRRARARAAAASSRSARPACARSNRRRARRAAHCAAARGETDLFITPGFDFRVVDRLVTNFHLPKSTLLMLVCAFAGHEHAMALYAHAIAQRYRFFSYGDAMLLSAPTEPRHDRAALAPPSLP